jgi:hypothetical protein
MISAWLSPLGRFLQRVSVEPYDWLDLRQVMNIEPFYSPVHELHLFSASGKDACIRAMAYLELDTDELAFTESTCAAPIHDGYLTMLEMKAVSKQADLGKNVSYVQSFFERERARDAESLLRERYANFSKSQLEQHEVFRLMDYPMFDQGNAHIGFGLMSDPHHGIRFLWSRIVFSHK